MVRGLRQTDGQLVRADRLSERKDGRDRQTVGADRRSGRTDGRGGQIKPRKLDSNVMDIKRNFSSSLIDQESMKKPVGLQPLDIFSCQKLTCSFSHKTHFSPLALQKMTF